MWIPKWTPKRHAFEEIGLHVQNALTNIGPIINNIQGTCMIFNLIIHIIFIGAPTIVRKNDLGHNIKARTLYPFLKGKDLAMSP